MQNYREYSSSESRIQQAVLELKTGQYTSIRKAAKAFEVKPSTLGHRYKRRESRIISHQNQQNLTESEETALAKWITTSTVTETPPSYAIIREMAEHIRHDRVSTVNESSIERVSYSPLGKNWVNNFMKRHPQFKATYAR